MRVFVTFGLLYLFVSATNSVGQVILVTNTLSQAQAIKLATHLKVGMREEDVGAFLATNKLYSTISVGDNFGWDAVYDLTNHCSLHLRYTARAYRTNWGGNGRLDSAFIQSNGVSIVSITLTNAP